MTKFQMIKTRTDNLIFINGEWRTLPAGTVLEVSKYSGSHYRCESEFEGFEFTIELLARDWNVERVYGF